MNNDESDRPMPGPSSRTRPPNEAGLRARQKVIGAGLKRLYDDVVDEDVPSDFMDLLSQFDKDSSTSGGEQR